MKWNQVPQDDDSLMEGRSREVCYAVDEKGNYVKVLSTGWEPKRVALQQAWDQIDDEAQEAVRRVLKGEASPLAFFMARCMFDIRMLADYTEIPKRKIKEHLEPASFKQLDRKTLEQYADAFGISAEELMNWSPAAHSSRDGDQ